MVAFGPFDYGIGIRADSAGTGVMVLDIAEVGVRGAGLAR